MNPLPSSAGIPPEVFCAQDYEVLASRYLAAPAHAYIAGGAGNEATLAANRKAFDRWQVMPRLLRDVRDGHTASSLAGLALAHPVMLAATAYQRLAHPEGELATARAAEVTATTMVLSTQSSIALEDVARCAAGAKWFQLYFQPRREATLDLLGRAEGAGFQAIVLTLDAPVQPASRRALRAGFRLPAACTAVNVAGYDHPPLPAPAPGRSAIFQGAMALAPRWDDLDWLLARTRLPVWIKGVMHPDDARALQARGVAGLVVSNHGGRALDGAPATLDLLPAVREAVGPALPVLLDGGVRSGTDVFKALALGADAVLVGRLPLYALAVAGALGVAHLLKLLREELELCMALAGCATLADVGRDTVVAARGLEEDHRC